MATFRDDIKAVIAFLGGCAGIVLDIDHIPQALGFKTAPRPLHLAGFAFALVAGLLYLYLLRGKKSEKVSLQGSKRMILGVAQLQIIAFMLFAIVFILECDNL